MGFVLLPRFTPSFYFLVVATTLVAVSINISNGQGIKNGILDMGDADEEDKERLKTIVTLNSATQVLAWVPIVNVVMSLVTRFHIDF